jgi:hypothetical protein
MRRSLRTLVLAGLVAVFTSGAAIAADFFPIAGFDRQLFPSHITATASLRAGNIQADETRLGDPRGVLGVKLQCADAKTPVTVTVECNDYFESSVFSGTLEKPNIDYYITPKIKFRYQKLAQCDQAAPTSITFRVQLGKQTAEEQTVTCTMRSINDCPFAFQSDDKVYDISYTFAAYVNEQHPFVDKLLREALDIGVVDRFTGYQGEDEGKVLLQAYALWDLLVARDIRYSNIITTAADSDSVASQHVRLIEDSINNSQANCVDGSVLFVSLLRKIGIDAFLVLEPSHCYAGFYAGTNRTKLHAIETTLLGDALDLEEITVPELIDDAIDEELRTDGSFASFVTALDAGTKQYKKATSKRRGNKESETRIIDIGLARKDGILPIAFQNKEEFVWRDYTEFLVADEEESEEDWSEEDEETEDEEDAEE